MNAPIYFVAAPSQSTREKAISILKKKGYSLLGDNRALTYVNSMYPAESWQFLIIKNGNIDFMKLPPTDSYSMALSMSDLLEFHPNTRANKQPVVEPNKAEMTFPEPAKYKISYIRADGKAGKYEISNPVSANKQTITCYCFGGKGIRSFQKARIKSISKI